MKRNTRIVISAASLAAAGLLGFSAGRASVLQNTASVSAAVSAEAEQSLPPDQENPLTDFSIAAFAEGTGEPAADSSLLPAQKQDPLKPEAKKPAPKAPEEKKAPENPGKPAADPLKPEPPKPEVPPKAEAPKPEVPKKAETPGPDAPKPAEKPAGPAEKEKKPEGPGAEAEKAAKAPARPL